MEAKDYVTELLAAGMTQAEIAEKTGMQQPTISKVARGAVDDVLSRNYRRLQELHATVVLKQPAPRAETTAETTAESAAQA